MSRNGAGAYTLPGTYEAVAGETILAAQHNDPLEDLEQDMNTARPIVAGGTGATTAIGAFDALVSTGSNIATAATLNLNNATAGIINLTGSTTVTAVTLAENAIRIARANAAFQLTAGSSLIVQGSTTINHVVQAGDYLVFHGFGSSVVRVSIISRPRIPTVQTFTSSGTWTKPAGCRMAVIEGVGGGGGGGGADGQGAGTYAAAGGGGSGAYGRTGPVDVTGIATSTITIGAAGAAGASGANDGGNGGSTIWNDGTNTFTFGGGNGGNGVTGSSSGTIRPGKAAATGANVVVGSAIGHVGVANSLYSVGGNGGASPYGSPGLGGNSSSGTPVDGSAASGYGAGGGAGAANATASNAAGAAGAPGYLRVWEFY